MLSESNSLSPVGRFLLLSAAFVVVVAGMKYAQPLLVQLLLSVFIAMICSPVLAWMRHRGVPPGLAITLIIVSVMIGVLLLGVVVGGAIQDFSEALPQYEQALADRARSFFEQLASMGVSVDAERLKEVLNPAVAMKLAGNVLASFGNTMGNALIIVLTVVFILAEEAGFANKLVQARGGDRSALLELDRFSKAVHSYMGLKTLISLMTGLVAYLLLLTLGIDYAVMWGLMAFLLNFVPTVGSILAALPPVLLATIQPGLEPITALWAAIGYVIINMVVGNVVEPKLMGKGLNLSSLVVFLSLIFWGWVLGPVGMLLSIPLTIMVKIALENNESTHWVGMMLGAGEEAVVLSDTEPADEADGEGVSGDTVNG